MRSGGGFLVPLLPCMRNSPGTDMSRVPSLRGAGLGALRALRCRFAKGLSSRFPRAGRQTSGNSDFFSMGVKKTVTIFLATAGAVIAAALSTTLFLFNRGWLCLLLGGHCFGMACSALFEITERNR